MDHTPSGGSPLPRGLASSHFSIHEDVENLDQGPKLQRPLNSVSTICFTLPVRLNPADLEYKSTRHIKNPSDGLAPLTSSKLGNVQAQGESRVLSENKVSVGSVIL